MICFLNKVIIQLKSNTEVFLTEAFVCERKKRCEFNVDLLSSTFKKDSHETSNKYCSL